MAAAILDGSFGGAWRDACRDAVARAATFVRAVFVVAGRAEDLRAVRRAGVFFAAARGDLRVAFAVRAVFRPPALVRFTAAALRAGRFAAAFRDPFFAAFFAALFAKSLLLSVGVRAGVPG